MTAHRRIHGIPQRWLTHRRERGSDRYWAGVRKVIVLGSEANSAAELDAYTAEARVMHRWFHRLAKAPDVLASIPAHWFYDERAAAVLKARWVEKKTLQTIGDEIGLSRERVRGVEKHAMYQAWRKAIRLSPDQRRALIIPASFARRAPTASKPVPGGD